MYANLTKLKEGDANEIKRYIMHIEYQESSVFSKEFLAFVPFLKYGSSLRKILKLVIKNKKNERIRLQSNGKSRRNSLSDLVYPNRNDKVAYIFLFYLIIKNHCILKSIKAPFSILI
ncbi:hypothetical protein [Peribacillus simplex]|uniref:Uncharacterized protein n=1 Tax=Peribacillus simplex TaxID=1478 RepID=A0AAW7IJ39_9BACI|nr:hypothetical protein [Peribacillus simplex]MDM5451892.1 hypothetical protein [Peribacillus simplex]